MAFINNKYFINSENIKFYPSGYRGKVKVDDDWYSIDPESKLNTEENVTRSYNVLIPYKNISQFKESGSLVITKNYHWSEAKTRPANDINDNFEFIIHGYYLKILHTSQVFPSILNDNPSDVYAHIRIKEKGIPETDDPNNIYLSGKAVISSNDEPIVNNPEGGSTTNYSNLDYTVDNNIIFYGLELLTTTPTINTESNSDGYEDYYFKILTRVDDDYIVPTLAKLVISLDDIHGGYELDAASKTIKTNTVKANIIESNTVNSNTVNATTVKTKNTVTEYITKDTTVAEGNNSYIQLADDYIRINREDDDLKLNSNINLKTNEIGLEQGTEYGNSHIRIVKNDGVNSLIELSADGSGSLAPSYMQIKKGLIHLYQGPGENEIKLSDSDSLKGILINSKKNDGITISTNDGSSLKYPNIKIDKNNIKFENNMSYINIKDNNSYINFHSQSIAEDIYNTVDSLYATHHGILIQQEGTNEQSDNAYQSYINLDAGKYDDNYSSNQKIWIPSIMLSTKIYNPTGTVDKRFVTELTSEKVETPLLNVKGNSIKFNSNISGHVSGIKSNSGDGQFNFYRNEMEDPARINAGALHLSGYNTTYLLEVYGATKAKTLYLTGTGTSTDTILDAKAGVVAANSFYATSDRRLKDHIEPIDYNKSILDLPVYTYIYKDSDKKQIGCMAQDLQQLYPELVLEDENGYLSVDNSKVVYLLLEEVKLLKKEIEDLKKSK